jgi:hypothetical protein
MELKPLIIVLRDIDTGVESVTLRYLLRDYVVVVGEL